MIALDVSVVIAYLNPRDAHHDVATAYLRHSAGERFVIHSLNLTEVLVGGVRVDRGQEMRSDLEAVGIEVADLPEDESLRLARPRVQCGLKLPDCCALDTALATGSALATFDEALARTARGLGIDVTP